MDSGTTLVSSSTFFTGYVHYLSDHRLFNLPEVTFFEWHATVSEADEKWTEGVFKQAFGNKPFDKVGFNQSTLVRQLIFFLQLSLADLGQVAKLFADVAPNPTERTFAG